MEMKSAAPLASSATRRLTSRVGARQLTANKIHGRVLIGLFWFCLRFRLFFFGRVKWNGGYGLGSAAAHRGEASFSCPNYCTVAASVFSWTDRRESTVIQLSGARLIVVLAQRASATSNRQHTSKLRVVIRENSPPGVAPLKGSANIVSFSSVCPLMVAPLSQRTPPRN